MQKNGLFKAMSIVLLIVGIVTIVFGLVTKTQYGGILSLLGVTNGAFLIIYLSGAISAVAGLLGMIGKLGRLPYMILGVISAVMSVIYMVYWKKLSTIPPMAVVLLVLSVLYIVGALLSRDGGNTVYTEPTDQNQGGL